jgi:hypothetical protein
VHNRAIEPAVFRRAGWEQVGGYCTTFSASGIEDWDLWLSLIELGCRAEVIPETIWEYRIRSDQMSTGMYQPDTWGHLMRDLVRRHHHSYQANLVEVVAQHAKLWTELRRWTNNREGAIRWWQRQAGNWERIAAEQAQVVRKQQARIAALEHEISARPDPAGGDA